MEDLGKPLFANDINQIGRIEIYRRIGNEFFRKSDKLVKLSLEIFSCTTKDNLEQARKTRDAKASDLKTFITHPPPTNRGNSSKKYLCKFRKATLQ